ncbi:hypothetical protein [Paenibacillus radicis (ex Gao et al. 2016)]|uniref:Nudix hydrolase domain-containing protein n=1 Tax=Paenibacillus radicis (ex Gao et al. 2016) TaxID=1737354 RepID=A0A917H498_9BACL|nr:hypothetical protein [Paenibacillus radicis (ex Gao et al. 2016)]GGG67474.1 hypothetical protein GCM10010918_22650 [Paenibacillus radicis (ex Gao et al. 2016)]
MTFLDTIWSWLINIPYLGRFLIGVFVLVSLNEIIDKISGYKPLHMLFAFLVKVTFSQKIDGNRKKYYDTLATEEFQTWQMNVIKKLYGEQNLVSLFGISYVTTVYSASRGISNSYKDIGELESTKIEENIILSGISKRYIRLMGKTIKRPDLAGFVLTTMKLDAFGQIKGFIAKIATYKLNVATSHVLEFELYLAYKKYKDRFLSFSKDQMLNRLKMRQNIHTSQQEEEILITGKGRYSLLGVQMLVVYLTNDDEYRVLVIKRSEDVAARPGYFQFVPSGGFEFFEKEKEISEINIGKNFDVELALYREMVEEIFGEVEFEHNGTGNPVDNIYKHKKVVDVRTWLKEDQAKLEFLGSTVDLVTLRHELSFLLLINNKQFSMNYFKRNHEATTLVEMDIKDLEKHFGIGKERLNPTSASLLKLALDSGALKKKIDPSIEVNVAG